MVPRSEGLPIVHFDEFKSMVREATRIEREPPVRSKAVKDRSQIEFTGSRDCSVEHDPLGGREFGQVTEALGNGPGSLRGLRDRKHS